MRLLTVFASPFNPQAVQAVADYLGGWSDERAVSAALAGLIDASLLSPSSREGQLRMLAIVRSFAIQRLADAGATHSAHLAHACWTRDLAEKAAVDSTGPQGAAAMARLNQVRADLASALHWTIDCGRLDVAAAIACSVQLCQHWTPDLELSDLIVDVASRCKSRRDPYAALALAAGGRALAERGGCWWRRLGSANALARPINLGG